MFKLMWGPFVKSSIHHSVDLSSNTFLFRPKFWDFLSQDLNSQKFSVYLPQKTVNLNREDFIGFLKQLYPLQTNVDWKNAQEEAFFRQYSWGQDKIQSGEIKKIVPIIRQIGFGEYNLGNRAYSLINLLDTESFGWSYGFFQQEEVTIGKTPEYLVHFDQSFDSVNSVASSMALAGTFPNDEDGIKKINLDFKTREEHEFVIKDIQAKTKRYQTSILPTEVLQLKYLLHLKTEFKFKVKNEFHALELVNCLHPTSAMGTYPTDLNILKEFSKFDLQFDRDFFAAPFGIVEKGLVHILVAIRCLRVLGQQFTIDSGCGITSESRYDDELTELKNKRNSVKKMLGLMHD